jgi:hypothetical protein
MPCTRERGLAIASNIHAHLAGQRARFVTLTLRTEGLPLREALSKLQHAFRRLLRTGLWRGRVTGGAAFLEVKWNPDSARWHPHIHAIVQGRYIPHDLLRRTWLLITGDSSVVRVQVVKSHESVTRYVTTYASKTVRTSDFPTDASLREAITALHGTRLCRTFGTWRGVALTKTEPEGVWIIVDSLQAILFAALQGDDRSRAILAALRTGPARQFLLDHPAKPPPLEPTGRAEPGMQHRFSFQPSPIT